jgi:transposase
MEMLARLTDGLHNPERMDSLEELRRINEELRRKIAILQQQIDWLKKQLFGRKNEKFDHPELAGLEEAGKSQASLADEGKPEEEAEGSVGKPKRRKRRLIRAERLPKDLPVVIEELIPAEVRDAPEAWREIGKESSDQLEKEPGYFYLKRTVRPKYVRRDHPFLPPVMAPAEPKLIENGFLGAGLLSEIISNKYLYSLPLYRQEQLYSKRFGIELSRKTMCDAVARVAEQCRAVVARMKERMLELGYLQGDETPVRYLDKTHPKGSALGYLWVWRSGKREVVFDWRTNRCHANVREFLGLGFEGVLQSDGYPAYGSYVAAQRLQGRKVRRMACLAHIRREFVNAQQQRPELARWFLRVIGKLYAIEEDLRAEGASSQRRARMRAARSRRILKLLEKAIRHLLEKSGSILPKSALGKALRYALGQWPAMQTYLEYGEVEIDNNLVENAIRPTAVGKKNHLFFGSPEAGQHSAILYSLLLSAKAQGVDPQRYLRDLIERLPRATTSDLDALTPANWAAAHKAAEKAATAAKAAAVALDAA